MQRQRHWSVYTCHYTARRADGRVKIGDRNMFQASSIDEVVEKLRNRGIAPAWADEDVVVYRVDYTETESAPLRVGFNDDPPFVSESEKRAEDWTDD